MIGARVRVINRTRSQYVEKSGVVVKEDKRDGKPYYGVEFAGVDHVVWFFGSELVGVAVLA